MLYRSLYILHLPHGRLRVKFGLMQIKNPINEIFSCDPAKNIKLSTFQCLKLGSKAQATKVRCDKNEEDLGSKCENENAVAQTSDISDKLVHWVMQNNISYIAFSRLLKILHENGLKNLPKNSKALLQAKEDHIKVLKIPPGVYYHFSLEKNLKILIEHLLTKKHNIPMTINISIFIDELLLSVVKKDCLWVILGSVVDFNNIVFGVGAYRGTTKPYDSNLFLSTFVNEVDVLCNKGLLINQTHYKIAIKRVICDAPAKAFILNVQSHSGYSSCTKCWVVGEHKKKICFPSLSLPKTDKDFEKSSMYKGQKTELLKIPNFGVVSNIPLDYMHLVCFGIVRKTLITLLSKLCVKNISEKVQKVEKLYEFQSKPKSLATLPSWNAIEFRQFLLYYSPVILHDALDKKYYDNFLYLHVGCRLLCMDHSTENAQLGRKLLHTFVEQYKNLYGVEEMSHNMHGLYHLVDDYVTHGTLDSFGSFIFEKFLYKLKRSMKKSKKKTLPQLILKESCLRVFNRSLLELTKDKCRLVKEEKISKGYSKYTYLHLSGVRIGPLSGDNYVLLKNNKIIKVVEIFKKEKKLFISGKEFSSVLNFYETPLESKKVKIFEVGNLSGVVQTWSVFMIDKKCIKVPISNDRSVMIGLLNES